MCLSRDHFANLCAVDIVGYTAAFSFFIAHFHFLKHSLLTSILSSWFLLSTVQFVVHILVSIPDKNYGEWCLIKADGDLAFLMKFIRD